MRSPSGAVSARTPVERELAARLGSAAEARWLVEAVVDGSGTARDSLVPGQLARLETLTARRLEGEPLQYLLGQWAFRSLELTVDPRALIPRPETEQVVEVALGELDHLAAGRPDPVVADLGTGTGAIALSLAAERQRRHPQMLVYASDVDLDALALAEANLARTQGAGRCPEGMVRLCQGRWFEALPTSTIGRLDLVVANPPYVAEAEWAALDPEVRREPRRALVAADGSDGTPGLAAVEAVLGGAAAWLACPGAVVVELAPAQAEAAADLARRLGFDEVGVENDLAGRQRALVARRAGAAGSGRAGRTAG